MDIVCITAICFTHTRQLIAPNANPPPCDLTAASRFLKDIICPFLFMVILNSSASTQSLTTFYHCLIYPFMRSYNLLQPLLSLLPPASKGAPVII